MSRISKHILPLHNTAKLQVNNPVISITQEGYLTHDRWSQEQSVPLRRRQYHHAMLITGRLDVQCLEQSILEIFRRHEVLRSRFFFVGGKYEQLIEPQLLVTLPLIDLRHLPESERTAEALRLGTAEALKEFDPSSDPLLRALIIKLEDEKYLLVLVFQHLAFDGWSQELFIWELVANYQALFKGQPPPLPNPALQYTDFAVWQRDYLQGEKLESLLSYWKRQIGTVPVPDTAEIELPFALPRHESVLYEGAAAAIELPLPLYSALRDLSRQKRVTLFMLLMAILKTLLYRYTGKADIAICTSTSGRERKDVEGVIGRFNYSLIMRTVFPVNPRFSELLERVRESTLGAYEHREIPFSTLLDCLRPPHVGSPRISTSNFVWFTFIPNTLTGSKAKMSRFADLGIKFERVPLNETELAQTLGITITAVEQSTKLNLTLRYQTDRFNRADIERMLEHFQALAQGVVDDPEQRLDELPLLSEAARGQLLGWAQTKSAPVEEICLHQRFEAQAARTPEAIALIADGQQFTYDELNRRANQLAHQLRRRGATQETLIGISIEPSAEFVLAVLGILKSGAACVLPNAQATNESGETLPEEARLSFMLSRKDVQEALACQDDSPQSVGNAAHVAMTLSAAFIHPHADESGQPALIVETHEGACNRLAWMLETSRLTASDRVLLLPTSDAVSVAREMLWPLSAGACLVLPEKLDATADAGFIAEQRVSVLRITPQLLQSLLRQPEFTACVPLRQVICVGEKLSPGLQQSFGARSRADLLNVYDVAESSGAVTAWPNEQSSGRHLAPIGRPIPNAEVYLLDAQRQPVPIGIPGELYIGGAGVCRGYLDNPELTAQRFIPHPFDTKGGARIFRTGDLARYLPDGTIEFIGRVSQDIELRGFNFNSSRVERTLEQHASVDKALVLLHEEAGAQAVLIAYLVLSENEPLDFEGLRAHLQHRLPTYMIPDTLAVLKEMPLTRTGKIDRRALDSTEQARFEIAHDWVEWP